MAVLYTLILSVVVPYVLWNCQSLFANYLKARKSGLPIYVCPMNPNNIFWMIFGIPYRGLLERLLPSFAFDRVKSAIYGWEFLSRYEPFARLGSAFILVTPNKNGRSCSKTLIANLIRLFGYSSGMAISTRFFVRYIVQKYCS